jgi:small-conductance mechanosensitive channel
MEKHDRMMKTNLRITLIFSLTLLICGIPGRGRTADIPPLRHDSLDTHQHVAVAPFGITLFYINSNVGPFPASQRAKAFEGKIIELTNNPFFTVDSLRLSAAEEGICIMNGSEILTVVTNTDTIAEKLSKYDIANARLKSISAAISEYQESHRDGNILRSVVYSVLILIFLILCFYLVGRLSGFLARKITTWSESHGDVIPAMKFLPFDRQRQLGFLLLLNKLFRFFAFFFLVIAGLLSMFYVLPWTKPFTMRTLQYILAPVKHILKAGWDYIPDFLAMAVIIMITIYIVRFFHYLKREIEGGGLKISGFYPEWALPTYNIIRVVIWIFAVMMIWPYIPGSDSKIFQGISVFLGLVFSLTSASMLSNIMAGFTLTYTRAFRIGDRVRIGEITGDVIEKSMLVTKVRTIKNEEVTIPNSKIMNAEVINYSVDIPEEGLILYTSVTIGYDAPWRQVHGLLLEAAGNTKNVLIEPKPFVLQTALNDFYISYQINVYTRESHRMVGIYSDLHQNIQDAFNKAGVEIMSPHYKSVRDGNTIAIPEENRPEGYVAPAFKVK